MCRWVNASIDPIVNPAVLRCVVDLSGAAVIALIEMNRGGIILWSVSVYQESDTYLVLGAKRDFNALGGVLAAEDGGLSESCT